MPPFFIAELGLNVFPYSRERLIRLVETAAEARADAVKIQLFRADHFPESEQREKIRFEFPRYEFDWFIRLAYSCGLQAGASAFDFDAIRLICAGADFLKLATREAENDALLSFAHRTYRGPIYRSFALREISSGWTRARSVRFGHPLGCIPVYPTDLETAMQTLNWLPRGWGWSSHTAGYEDCVDAAERGVPVIEKHLRLSANDPEAPWSLDGFDFARMVKECSG